MGFFSKIGEYLFGAQIPDATDAGAFFAVYFFDRDAALENKPSWFQKDGLFDRIFGNISWALGGVNNFFASLWNGDAIKEVEGTFNDIKTTLDNTHYNNTAATGTAIPVEYQQAAVNAAESILDRSYGAGARWMATDYGDIGDNAHNLAESEIEEEVFRAVMTKNGFGAMANVNYEELKKRYENDPALKPVFDYVSSMAGLTADKLHDAISNKDPSLLELSVAEVQSLQTLLASADGEMTTFGATITNLQQAIERAQQNDGLKNIGVSDDGVMRIAFQNLDAGAATGRDNAKLTTDELTEVHTHAAAINTALAGNATAKQEIAEIAENITDVDITDLGTTHIRFMFEGNGKSQELIVAR
jgi:hypothetical protein